MAELGIVQVSIEGDWSGFQRQIQSEAKTLGSRLFGGSNLTKTLDSLGGTIVSKIGGAVKKVSLGVLGIGTAVSAIALKGGLNRALTTDTARVQLQRMGYDLKEIDNLVKTVSDTFDGTVFTTPQGFALVQKLLGVGVATKDVGRELATIADLAAHADVELERLGEIYIKTAAAGKLTAQELNQISIAGISLEPIAQTLGMTSAEMRKLASEGKLTHEMFWGAAGATEMYAGAAKAAGQTVAGAWSNVRSNLARLGEAFLSPLFGDDSPLLKFLHAIRAGIRSLIPYADDLGTRFGEWLVPRIEALTRWLDAGGLEGVLQRVAGWFETVNERVQAATEWYRQHEEMIHKIVEAVVPAAGALGGLATSVHLVTKAMTLLQAATPVGIILTLASALVYAYQNSEKFREVVNRAFETVKSVVGPIIENLIGWIRNIGTNTDEVSVWLREKWDEISKIPGLALEFIQEAVKWFIDWAKVAWRIFGDDIVAYARAAWEFIQRIIDDALRVIRGLLDFFIGLFRMDWDRAWEGAKNVVAGVWDAIVGAVKFGFQHLATVFKTIIRTVTQFGSEIVAGIWNGIKSAGSWLAEKLKSWVKSVIPGPIASILGIRSPSRLMMEYGRDIGLGLAEGLFDSERTVVAAAERLASSLSMTGAEAVTDAFANADVARVMPIINHFHGPVGGSMSDFAAEIERQRALEAHFV